ncbi:MAG TPA: hypothetical protein VKT78_18770 [Fimbriimonadaceae bacterium]|nr:hypothetical protein [Fimbriimonadaceae bacterium]
MTPEEKTDTPKGFFQKKRGLGQGIAGIAEQKMFKSRRQSLPQPMTRFEFAKQSGRLDAVRTFSGWCPRLEGQLGAIDLAGWRKGKSPSPETTMSLRRNQVGATGHRWNLLSPASGIGKPADGSSRSAWRDMRSAGN